MVFLRRLLIFGAVVAGLLAASCVPLPTDSSWGDISLVGSTPNIMLAFNDKIVQVSPIDGTQVDRHDGKGNILVDDQGKPLPWQAQVTGGAPVHFYTRPLLIDDTTLLAASYEQNLYNIDIPSAQASVATVGAPLPGYVVANPLLTDTTLYVPLSNGGLVALDRTDYTQLWQFTEDKDKGIWSQPLLVDGTLYVSSMDHHLYALDAGTGAVIWNLDLEGAVASTPTYANGTLYVGSFARKIFKIAPDGSIIAQYSTNDWVWGAPAVVDGVVYASDLGGYVYALHDSGSSLDEVWSRKVAGGAIRMTPLVTADTIVVGSRDHNVYWLSRESGDEKFHQETKGEVLSDILLLEPNGTTIREPTLIVSTLAPEQLLVAFSLETKRDPFWVYPHS